MSSAQKIIQAAAGNAASGEPLYVEDVFSTYLYTGTNATQTITNGVDLENEGGLVWIKNRATYDHQLIDSAQGFRYVLESNTTDASFDFGANILTPQSDGFELTSATRVNKSSDPHTSWTFRKAPKFFDVVTYTGNGAVSGSPLTINHGLNATVGMILVKQLTDYGANWFVYHRSLGVNSFVLLNLTNAALGYNGGFDNITSTSFDVFDSNATNGKEFVAYLFAHNDGDGEFGENADQDIIKCGSYTGNGSTDGPEIDLGFEPQWLLVKRAVGGTEFWQIVDNMRGATTGGNDSILYPNANNAEVSTDVVEFNATGFQPKTTSGSWNASGNTYIYIAIRRGPMKTPESGTEVFAIDTRGSTGDGNTPAYRSTFPVDLSWYNKDTRGSITSASARLTGNTQLYLELTNSEAVEPDVGFDHMNGMLNYTNTVATAIAWMFGRAPGFFDVVCYTGDNTTGQNINHNLNAVPEMILVKNREPANKPFVVYHSGANGGVTPEQYGGILNSTTAFFQYDGYWSDTAPTSTQFTVSTDDSAGGNYDYIAYLFATLDGISKVGSYTGNGTSQTIDCGFSAGARFFLVKASSTTGDWHVFDTERGIIAGNDPYLELNTTNAEDTDEDAVDPVSSGIIVNETSASNINTSGVTYIFMAIA